MKNLKKLYFGNNISNYIYKRVTKHPDYIFYKAVLTHKKYRKYKDKRNIFLKIFYAYKANRISSRYNLELYGKFGDNLRIWHGNIIINGDSLLGNNIQLHGNNCIGTNGKGVPVIGNNVEIGYGTVIIGNVTIGDNCIIGANSIVTRSFPSNSVIVGNPAKIMK